MPEIKSSKSVAHTAELLDVSPATIHRMLDDGRLRGHFLGTKKRIYDESIIAFQIGNEILPKTQAKQETFRKTATQRIDTLNEELRAAGL